MKKTTYTKIRYLLISITVTLALAVPCSFLAMPHMLRWKYTSQLVSPDLHLREQGLSYVIMKAREDSQVRDAAFHALEQVDGDNFTQIQSALDNAGQWKRPIVPKAIWLKWCNMLGAQTDPKGRILGTQMAAELADDVENPKLHDFLTALLKDKDADVRYNALIAAASLGGDSQSPRSFQAEFDLATKDANSIVAREAWIFLGIFELAAMPAPSDGIPAESLALRESGSTSPAVGQTMLWARVKTHPQGAWEGALARSLSSTTTDPGVQSMAAYCLHMLKAPKPDQSFVKEVGSAIAAGTSPSATGWQRIVAWRAMLSLPAIRIRTPDIDSAGDRLAGLVKEVVAPATLPSSADSQPSTQPTTQPASALSSALAYVQLSMGMEPSGGLASPFERLAYAEGINAAWSRPTDRSHHAAIVVDPDAPDMLRLAAVQASSSPNPDDLYPLFSAPDSTLRDLAVQVAATRMTPEQNRILIHKALTDFNDQAKMSGAILSGLTGLESQFLEKKLGESRIWEVEQLMQIGLWMQGKLPSFEQKAVDLLTRADLPASTLLMAQLHHGHTLALDYLLNPQGEPSTDLVDLFDPKRWSSVLWMYLPDDAPEFWVWGDPDLERFQIDVLRNWYLVHRKTLKLPGEAKIKAIMATVKPSPAATAPTQPATSPNP